MKDKDFITIEEHFSQKREVSTLLSPLDWQLIEQWKKMGIPLKVIINGIDRSFEKFKRAKKKGVTINSLSYCNQEVLAAWEEYKELTIGRSQENLSSKKARQLWRNKTEKKLVDLSKNLNKSALKAAKEGRKELEKKLNKAAEEIRLIIQQLDNEGFDIQYCYSRLSYLDDEISNALLSAFSKEEIEKVKSIAVQELQKYKDRIEHDIYKKIIDNFIKQFLQQKYGIPRLNFLI
jgi:hypothetical protein